MRLMRHIRSIAGKSISPYTAVSTTAASTAFGKFASRPVRKSRHSASVQDAKISASVVRAPALSLTADCDRPPATTRVAVRRVSRPPPPPGIAMAQGRREVGRANSEEFLPRIEAIAMLRRKRAGRGNTFDVGEQQTPGSQRNDPLDIAQAQGG